MTMQKKTICIITHDPLLSGAVDADNMMRFLADQLVKKCRVTLLFIHNGEDGKFYKFTKKFCQECGADFVGLKVRNTYDIPYPRKISFFVFSHLLKFHYNIVVGYDLCGALFHSIVGQISGTSLIDRRILLLEFDGIVAAKNRAGQLLEDRFEIEYDFLEQGTREYAPEKLKVVRGSFAGMETASRKVKVTKTCLEESASFAPVKVFIDNSEGCYSSNDIYELTKVPYVKNIIVNLPRQDALWLHDTDIPNELLSQCCLSANDFFDQADNNEATIFGAAPSFNFKRVQERHELAIIIRKNGKICRYDNNNDTFISLDAQSIADALSLLGRGRVYKLYELSDALNSLLDKEKKKSPASDFCCPSVSPKVSVCITHFNRPKLLGYVLESVRSQTYKNFEVILVDDGSTKLEAKRCIDSLEDEFTNRGWKIIRQGNSYLGAARNTAARYAEGKYLLFVDDDNYAMPNMIATLVRAAETSGKEIITCTLKKFTGTSRPTSADAAGLFVPIGSCLALGTIENCFGDASALVLKTAFEEIGGFTEDYGVGYEDWEFFLKAIFAGFAILPLPETLFWYRISSESMVRTTNMLLNHKRILRTYQNASPTYMAPIFDLVFSQSLQLDKNCFSDDFKIFRIIKRMEKIFDCFFPKATRRRKYAIKLLHIVVI